MEGGNLGSQPTPAPPSKPTPPTPPQACLTAALVDFSIYLLHSSMCVIDNQISHGKGTFSTGANQQIIDNQISQGKCFFFNKNGFFNGFFGWKSLIIKSHMENGFLNKGKSANH